MAIIVRYLLHVSLTHRGVLSQTLLALALMAQSGCYLSISQGLMRSAERHFIVTGVDEVLVGPDGSVALIGEGECRTAPPSRGEVLFTGQWCVVGSRESMESAIAESCLWQGVDPHRGTIPSRLTVQAIHGVAGPNQPEAFVSSQLIDGRNVSVEHHPWDPLPAIFPRGRGFEPEMLPERLGSDGASHRDRSDVVCLYRGSEVSLDFTETQIPMGWDRRRWHHLHLLLLPFTIVLDTVTSPIQMGMAMAGGH